MKLTYTLTPEEKLRYASESLNDAITKGFSTLSEAAAKLKGIMPGIIQGFSATKEAVVLPDIVPLDKYQKAFLSEIESVPYTELRELRAFVPEGVSVTYLEYLKTLVPVTTYLKDIQRDVTSPYLFLLAQMVSDVNANISTKSEQATYEKLKSIRDEAYASLAKLYEKNSYKAVTKVGAVVERNADWKDIFTQLKSCVINVESVNRESIARQVKQCTDYLEIIYQNLSKDNAKSTSQEAAQNLAAGAYEVAQQLQFFSTTYYRVLALNGSVKNTIEHIQKSI
ncbi:MAG: hypothetical protein PHQ58_04995 [Rhodoferax sp.]|uniref:hypothetical protein n=1 Tax=Rhodoferax sp. TaxID=50421 RepID=UPI0026285CA8|nr:hypothetical protein [Rhodoferax sp.]MDD2879771.1 hypothetical protein [Rhodoferax sp.]